MELLTEISEPASPWTTVRRYSAALWRQSPGQVGARIAHLARLNLAAAAPRLTHLGCAWKAGRAAWREDFHYPEARGGFEGGYLGSGRFEFLGEAADFSDGIDWVSHHRPLLWRFRLHYFDWAPRLASQESWDELDLQVRDWIAHNPPGSQPGWHPYPTSVRIANWVRAASLNPERPKHWLPSLRKQAALLEASLERHLGANHLIENAFALLVAGLALKGRAADRWRKLGAELLRSQTAAQVLPDGGHIERSLSYHFRVQRILSESIELLCANGERRPDDLIVLRNRMAAFFGSLRHQDGGIPLFQDAELIDQGELRRASRLQSMSLQPISFGTTLARIHALESSGYYALRQGCGTLLADFGAPGDSPNPGHAHAGIFSFEISSGETRVVTDSGAPTYEPGPERLKLRGTAAHNTIRIDRQDQFELWESFRVGRSAHVSGVRHGEARGSAFVLGRHNGYRRLRAYHQRIISSVSDSGWLIVDEIDGKREREVESFVGLGPALQAKPFDGGIAIEPIGWALHVIEGPKFEARKGVYAERIGHGRERVQLRAGGVVSLPIRWIYWICPAPQGESSWRRPLADRLELTCRGDVVAVSAQDWTTVLNA